MCREHIIKTLIIMGGVTGLPTGWLLKRCKSKASILAVLIIMIPVTSAAGFVFNSFLPAPVLNFMLMGMSFSAVFSNMVDEHDLEKIIKHFEPVLVVSLIVVILNLGVSLNYKAILGAGFFTVLYIVSRAFGKYFGAKTGAKVSKMPDTVQKYLGFTLLPHSGVSLVFAGIAVSVLTRFESEYAIVIQGTIAAAAIINEIIAVIMAKKAFEWSGEMTVTKAK